MSQPIEIKNAFSTSLAVNGTMAVSSLPSIAITNDPLRVLSKPTYAVSTENCNTTSQTIRASAGTLSGIYVSHVGGSQTCYFKLYNSSSATSSDTPVMTIPLHKDTTQYISCGNLNFSGGLCIRGTDLYAAGNNDPPTGVLHCTSFLMGYYE